MISIQNQSEEKYGIFLTRLHDSLTKFVLSLMFTFELKPKSFHREMSYAFVMEDVQLLKHT